ncbi:16S rRNA processing protein RimM [Taibaiella sp. KBW10]|uniref:ribosome maturation factor RimM n=1 Tax=Taibaiella sp. KBW10 TaxID=2153357 RepID=UPI000F59BD71|nr:ribosome maturation factor RimM [Taibaiella sp. KBW10]RQO30835.1 16S rRNA processing protein RimM [Taibaiella sp. KBW10]
MNDYIQIGKITNTHGLEGRLSLMHNLGKNKELKQLKHIFIELKRESYIPFFINKITVDNDKELFLILDEVDSVEAAKALAGKEVYLSTEQYEKMKPKDQEVNFVGFEVWDEAFGLIGKVSAIFETPGQLLATVMHQEKEVIVPLNEQTIKSIQIQTKTLKLQLPEGLIEVYLED